MKKQVVLWTVAGPFYGIDAWIPAVSAMPTPADAYEQRMKAWNDLYWNMTPEHRAEYDASWPAHEEDDDA